MDLFLKIGKMALSSRLRLLTAKLTEDAAQIYALYKVEFSPKWFPVFFVLSEDGEKTITEIANAIGQSQPSVSRIIREMKVASLVQEDRKSKDKRRNVVALSKKGIELSDSMSMPWTDMNAAVDTIIAEARHNLWEAVEEWEFLLEKKSLLRRVQEQKKLRESKDVHIVEYEACYQSAFKSLNEEWISTFFEMEEADYKALDNPKEYILDKGGKIFVALYHNEPVGVCALIKIDQPYNGFELAKMAVSPKIQGKSIGWLLGLAAVNAAKELGASKIYLESNTMLKPAINLYQKLGFQKTEGYATPYKRCNIQMELNLNNKL